MCWWTLARSVTISMMSPSPDCVIGCTTTRSWIRQKQSQPPAEGGWFAQRRGFSGAHNLLNNTTRWCSAVGCKGWCSRLTDRADKLCRGCEELMTLEKGAACGPENLRTINCDKFRCWMTSVSRRGCCNLFPRRVPSFSLQNLSCVMSRLLIVLEKPTDSFGTAKNFPC